jgi:hypothetical protein
LPLLPADRAWDTAALSAAGRLTVVPEPGSAAAILVLAGGAALSRRRVRR